MKRRRQIPNDPQNQESTGSSSPGGPVFLAIGKLRRSHGVKGEMIMDVLTDFPERIQVGNTVHVGETHQPMQIASLRGHDQAMIIRLEGIELPEDAGQFRNQIIYVKAASLPELPEGQYYHHELLGMSVVDESGQLLGKLADILETGANDVYLVMTPEGKELLLPAIEDVILRVDLDRREMSVRPPDWL